MKASLAILVLLLAGCPTPSPVVEPDDEPTEPRPIDNEPYTIVGQPVAVPPQFEPGCTPLSDTEELRGEVKIISFGKHGDGVIIDDGSVKWVVSYDDESVFADFANEEVLARGRQCEKQGSAVKAYHFEVRSLYLID